MKLFAFIVLLCCSSLAHAQDDAAWRAALQNPKVQKYALQLARHSITHWLDKKQILPAPDDVPAALQRRCGVIVTYEKHGQIAPRGCRGTIAATKSNLAQEIIANAIAAATRDARVKPLQRDELAQCRISLTIILATKPIQSLAQHDAAHNGLIAQSGEHVGLVVPFEGRDADTQLLWAKRKAGLKDDARVQMREVFAVRFRE